MIEVDVFSGAEGEEDIRSKVYSYVFQDQVKLLSVHQSIGVFHFCFSRLHI